MKLFKVLKRPVAFAVAAIMAVSLIPASPLAAKTKYKTKIEGGKEYIVFGSYEQDDNTNNGKEPIEWEVLDENKNGILYVLPGCMQEHIIYQLYRFDYTLHQIDYKMETISKERFKASCLSCVKICEFCFDNYDADFYKSVYSSL